MTRSSSFLAVLALLAASVPPAAAQGEREPESIDSLWLGEQVAGSRLVFEDLEGRVVLAYHWCVS